MPKMFNRAGRLLLIAPLLIAPMAAPLAATTLVQMSHAEMAKAADVVLTGRATATETTWVGKTLVTLVTVQVGDKLKGDPGSEITVAIPGGVDAKRPVPVAQIWPDAPRLGAGQEALLFLNRRSDLPNAYSVTGYSQGAFAIATDPAGRKTVSRDLSGVSLSNDQQVVRGKALVTPLADFEHEIRSILAKPQPASQR